MAQINDANYLIDLIHKSRHDGCHLRCKLAHGGSDMLKRHVEGTRRRNMSEGTCRRDILKGHVKTFGRDLSKGHIEGTCRRDMSKGHVSKGHLEGTCGGTSRRDMSKGHMSQGRVARKKS